MSFEKLELIGEYTVEFNQQQILRKPILDIAARLWEGERYDAFRICYRSMRAIDDLIDNRKATGKIVSEAEKRRFVPMVKGWAEAIHGTMPCDSAQKQVVETIAKFGYIH